MLVPMQQRLIAAPDFEKATWVILDDVIALHGAEFGSLQFSAGGELLLVAQRGFQLPFLQQFRRIDQHHDCVCGRVLRLRSTVVVPDVEKDPELLPLVAIARDAGFRAVQSTPLLLRDDTLVGVVSTHFANVHAPTPVEMRILAEYSAIAAQYLHQLLRDDLLAERAETMCRKLYRQSARRTHAMRRKR